MPRLLGTLHAAEHALIALLPLWAMCDRWDIGGLSTNIHFQTGRPTIFVYDGHPGGVGITERGFDAFEGWVEDTARLLARLPVRARLPVLRPVAEVRQPERAARQGAARSTLRCSRMLVHQRRARRTPPPGRERGSRRPLQSLGEPSAHGLRRGRRSHDPSPSTRGPGSTTTTRPTELASQGDLGSVPHSPPTAITASPLATTARLRAWPIPVATACSIHSFASAARLARDDADRRPPGFLGAARRCRHHPAEPTADERAPGLGKQAADLLGQSLELGAPRRSPRPELATAAMV